MMVHWLLVESIFSDIPKFKFKNSTSCHIAYTLKIDFISYNLQKRTPFISPQGSLFCHCLCGIFHYKIKVYTCTIKNHTFKNLRRSDGYFIDHTASSSCWDLSCCRCEHPSCGGHCRSADQDYTPEGPRSGWQKLHRRQEDWQLLLGTDWVRVLQLDGHSAYVSSHVLN